MKRIFLLIATMLFLAVLALVLLLRPAKPKPALPKFSANFARDKTFVVPVRFK